MRVATGLALLILFLGPMAASADPRKPLSAEERAGVQLAADYLANGASSWWDALATFSKLRQLGSDVAVGEIEVRAGASKGARWTLRTPPAGSPSGTVVFAIEAPSGLDHTLFLGLVEESGTWKLDTVTTLAEPRSAEDLASFAEATSLSDSSTEPTSSSGPPSLWALSTPVLALVLLVAGLLFGLRGRMMPAYALLGAAIVVLAVGLGLLLGLFPSGPSGQGPETVSPEMAAKAVPELRELRTLRDRLDRSSGEEASPAPGSPAPQTEDGSWASGPKSPLGARVATLWQAQRHLAENDLVAAERALDSLPSPAVLPLTELLRAQLALARQEVALAAVRYETLLQGGLGHDGLLIEMAMSLGNLGMEERAEGLLVEAMDLGSRDAEVYYSLAEIAVWERQLEKAQDHLETAWKARPRERAELLQDSLLAILLEEKPVRRLLALDAPVAPSFLCPESTQKGLKLGEGFTARLLGEHLQVTDGSAALEVPSGCGLAPPGTPKEDPVSWRKREEALALDRLPELLRAARLPGALARPTLHRPVEQAALALAQSHRWPEVVKLTESLPDRLGRVPSELVWLRAQALEELGMRDQAKQLLLRLIRENQTQKRTDPATFYRLANMYLEDEDFETALRLTARADALTPYEVTGDRVRRIRIEERVTDNPGTATTPHFFLRFPADWSRETINDAARVLESEYLRLQRWVPVQVTAPIEVQFLPFSDYQNAFSPDFEAVALYDGKVRLPFGEIWTPHPFLVSIVSHELTHALIAERTEDRAPRWFHEGLAQHVQMLQERLNPLEGLKKNERALAFPLLEPALQSLNPNLVGLAYEEANWVLHYIEDRHGVRTIHRLLDAFREGRNTEDALAEVLNVTPVELDRGFWEWGATDAPAMWEPQDLIRYDL